MTRTQPLRRAPRAVLLAACAAVLAAALTPGPAVSARKDDTPTLKEIAHDFEMQRLVASADRVAALQRDGQSVAALLQHGVDPDERVAARLLEGAIRAELGEWAAAAEADERALDAA